MTTLSAARVAADEARAAFLAAIPAPYTEWDWYRGTHGVLNADLNIKAKHERYLVALHRYHLLRDGPNGFLGGRCK